MLPAYYIPLDDNRLKLIGEICAIQGQIEWIMLNTVWQILGVEKQLALRIMGSTAIGTNADIWLRCVRKKQRNKYMLAMAQRAHDDIKDLAEGRNDFVHAAYFARRKDEPDKAFTYIAEDRLEGPLPDTYEAIAVRVRNDKIVPADRLNDVREKAAEISVRMAHVFWQTLIYRTLLQPSPWLHRLEELPPLDFPKPEPRRAKGQKYPPKASAKSPAAPEKR